MKTTKDEYLKLVKAWTNGTLIEAKSPTSNAFYSVPWGMPVYDPETIYRKVVKSPRYKIGIFKSETHCFPALVAEPDWKNYEVNPQFIRWDDASGVMAFSLPDSTN